MKDRQSQHLAIRLGVFKDPPDLTFSVPLHQRLGVNVGVENIDLEKCEK